MKVNFSSDRLSKPEILFGIAGTFFLVMALISNISYHLVSSDPFAHEFQFYVWSKVYFCLSIIMGIMALNYMGIKGGWLVKLNPRLSQVHFWLTFSGICFLLINMESSAGSAHHLGDHNHIHHHHAFHLPTILEQIKSFALWRPSTDTSIFMILIGQLVWGMNFLYNLLLGNEEGKKLS